MSVIPRIRHRARSLWIALASSLWFIPGIIVAGSLALAVLLVQLSVIVDDEMLAKMPRLFGAGPSGSRDMLSTIAGSVITVAGVTFSITIAALALASAQYTPRVLRTFMGDRANQVVLGTFVGVYAYCLVVLRTIRGGDEGTFVPSIAVLFGFLLALVSVALLIFFIHHIAAALQASTILDRVRKSTERAIAELFPEEMGEAADVDRETALAIVATADASWSVVTSVETGYVQSVDADGLLAFARSHDVVVRMERAVGDFVPAGLPLVSVARTGGGADRTNGRDAPLSAGAASELRGLYTIDAHRTVEQDAAFGILQISDIALKALSPGVNDTTTAATCVDHLAALLARIAGRRIAPRARGDGSRLRVIARGPTFADFVDLALDDVRRNAKGNVTILSRLFDAIETTAGCTRDAARRRVLLVHVERLVEACERSVEAASDRALLEARARSARALLAAGQVHAPATLATR